jgi:uncharacterized protein (DUF58 family)
MAPLSSRAATLAGPARPVRFDEYFLRKLEALTVVAKRARGSATRADRRARRIGAGIDFADHRTYVPGDDVRALDWNLFARLDRPFVRLREEEEDLTLSLIVDASASMAFGAPAKLELAVRIAAALAYVGLSGLDRVGVGIIGDGVHAALPALRGRGNAARILELLGGAGGGGRTDLDAGVRDLLATRGPARRGRTVLISDLFDPAGPLGVLSRLRAARQDAVVIQIVSPGDAGPAAVRSTGGTVILEDAETGETRDVVLTTSARDAQADRYRAWLRGIAGVCRERAVPCFQIDASVPFEDAVLRILRAGGIVA